MSDLVISATDLGEEAVEAFRVGCGAQRVLRRPQIASLRAARLLDIADDPQALRVIAALAAYWRCDAALVAPTLRTGQYRALVLDMDSTLITIESIDELAAFAGKGAQVAAITEAAMRGEITDYARSLRQRVALLAGADQVLLDRILQERLHFSPGAHALLAGARAHGWKTLLVSGGFAQIAAAVQVQLGIDASCANQLLVHQGRLTGEVCGPADNGGHIIDAAGKAQALRRFCARIGCTPGQAIAMGDGANDLAMMAAAGLSIAYRAKPLVRERAGYTLDHSGLDATLGLFADRW